MSIAVALSLGLFLVSTGALATTGTEQSENSKMPFLMDDTVFEALMTSFRRRNIGDWARHWRVERHRRCTMQLHQHMDLVCRVYDVRYFKKRASNEDSTTSRRLRSSQSEDDTEPNVDLLSLESADDPPTVWDSNHIGVTDGSLPPWQRSRRRRSLTAECCYREEGCSWADFAAFCDMPPDRRHPLLT